MYLCDNTLKIQMKRLFFLWVIELICNCISAQVLHTDTLAYPIDSSRVSSLPWQGDSLSSGFIITIPKRVPLHCHHYHSEYVVVISGEGMMNLGNSTFPIRQGSIVWIPQNTMHSVNTTSVSPLRVLSIQAPKFDGNDRHLTPK